MCVCVPTYVKMKYVVFTQAPRIFSYELDVLFNTQTNTLKCQPQGVFTCFIIAYACVSIYFQYIHLYISRKRYYIVCIFSVMRACVLRIENLSVKNIVFFSRAKMQPSYKSCLPPRLHFDRLTFLYFIFSIYLV